MSLFNEKGARRCVANYVDEGGDEPDVMFSECAQTRSKCYSALPPELWRFVPKLLFPEEWT